MWQATILSLCGALLVAALARHAPQSVTPPDGSPAGPEAVSIGTFRARDLVIAYYRSQAFRESLASLRQEMKAAKERGNDVKVKELNRKGSEMQEMAHGQLAGDEPITNILDHLKPFLPEVARTAGVKVIVTEVLYRDPSIKTVDVTRHLVAKLPPARR